MEAYNIDPKNICPHCAADNPDGSYCCLNCFKVMKVNKGSSFWKMRVRPSVATVIIVAVGFFAAGVILNRWLASVEANMTINVQTAQYNLSLVADKVKKESDISISTHPSE